MNLFGRLICPLALIVGLFSPAFADGRFALVIGNSSYRPGFELRNPVADARAVARSFADLGYAVTLLQDTDLATAQRALDAFVPAALKAESVVIFYAGHGAMVENRSFMLPVDFTMTTFERIDTEALDTERLLQALSSTHADFKMLVFDACRNNPLEDRGAQPLAQPDQPPPSRTENMLAAFSTAQGMTALDGSGDHSPFAEGLLDNIATPTLELNDLMQAIRNHVRERTDGRQTVWIESSMTRPVFLAAAPAATGALSTVEPPKPAAGQGEVFPQSSTTALTEADLERIDAARLRLARNEIFARNGQIFRDEALATHFSQFPWYRAVTYEPKFNAVEIANVELIRTFEMRAAVPVSDFIFPDSDRRLLTADEVSPLNAADLRIARNEIYARRGRKFVRQDLQEHFGKFDWYKPQFGEVELTFIEQKNVDLIRKYE
ncbi:MAG: YARHG domain-containing protein [Rhizobiaceae bacterium]|nr:YARHG domain-containing protein [Rhizobiaceae bacterium]